MSDLFTSYEYVVYLRRHWRVPMIAAVTAVIAAAGITLMLPKRYTAVSSVLIDAPGISDPRLALGVSAVYLESLKSYERLAGGDSLFADMVNKFHLLDGADRKPIESLKREILKVDKIRDTRVLEIRVTLRNPVLAQQCAQFLAEQTVTLSHRETMAADQEFSTGLRTQLLNAKERLESARHNEAAALGSESADALQSEVDTTVELLTKAQQSSADASADVAEYEQRQRLAGSQTGMNADERDMLRVQFEAAKARLSAIRGRVAELKQGFDLKSRALSAKAADRDRLQTEVRLAETDYAAALNHLNDTEASNGTRSERLRVIDVGIVPQRPSSPNLSLNVLVALVLSVLALLIYTAFGFANYVASPRRFTESIARRDREVARP